MLKVQIFVFKSQNNKNVQKQIPVKLVDLGTITLLSIALLISSTLFLFFTIFLLICTVSRTSHSVIKTHNAQSECALRSCCDINYALACETRKSSRYKRLQRLLIMQLTRERRRRRSRRRRRHRGFASPSENRWETFLRFISSQFRAMCVEAAESDKVSWACKYGERYHSDFYYRVLCVDALSTRHCCVRTVICAT